MSGEQRRVPAPQEPPWSPDLLADLHGDVLDQQTADELRSAVAADPRASEILAALDATRADLAAIPPVTMPDEVADQIEAALRQEASAAAPAESPAGAQVVDLAEARRKRRRRVSWSAGLLTAAATVGAVLIGVAPWKGTQTTPEAQPPIPGSETSQPLALAGQQVALTPGQFTEVLHSKQYGKLSDPQKLEECLLVNGVTKGRPMAAREVTLNGRPAELLVLPTGRIGRFRLLAVGPECGPGNPAKISDSSFGG